jgi:hypothetical protein
VHVVIPHGTGFPVTTPPSPPLLLVLPLEPPLLPPLLPELPPELVEPLVEPPDEPLVLPDPLLDPLDPLDPLEPPLVLPDPLELVDPPSSPVVDDEPPHAKAIATNVPRHAVERIPAIRMKLSSRFAPPCCTWSAHTCGQSCPPFCAHHQLRR